MQKQVNYPLLQDFIESSYFGQFAERFINKRNEVAFILLQPSQVIDFRAINASGCNDHIANDGVSNDWTGHDGNDDDKQSRYKQALLSINFKEDPQDFFAKNRQMIASFFSARANRANKGLLDYTMTYLGFNQSTPDISTEILLSKLIFADSDEAGAKTGSKTEKNTMMNLVIGCLLTELYTEYHDYLETIQDDKTVLLSFMSDIGFIGKSALPVGKLPAKLIKFIVESHESVDEFVKHAKKYHDTTVDDLVEMHALSPESMAAFMRTAVTRQLALEIIKTYPDVLQDWQPEGQGLFYGLTQSRAMRASQVNESQLIQVFHEPDTEAHSEIAAKLWQTIGWLAIKVTYQQFYHYYEYGMTN